MRKIIFAVTILNLLIAFPVAEVLAQAGVTASPSRLYFSGSGSKSKKIEVINPSDQPLEIGVTISDWSYDAMGSNQIFDANTLPTSASSSIKVLPGSYFTLKPHEKKELTVQYKHDPAKKAPYETGMIFLTQLNPTAVGKNNGAALQLTVRVGIKVYYSPTSSNPVVNVDDMKDTIVDSRKKLLVALLNKGKTWADGTCKWELTNAATGKKTKLATQEFYTLPGDRRVLLAAMPADLPKGKYTATSIVTYGKNKDVKASELEFEL